MPARQPSERRQTQAQMTRALKAVAAAGVDMRVRVKPDGEIIFEPVDGTQQTGDDWGKVK